MKRVSSVLEGPDSVIWIKSVILGKLEKGGSAHDSSCEVIHVSPSNDPSSATAAAKRADCNPDGPPPFAAAHG
jgi:hypothetical protein